MAKKEMDSTTVEIRKALEAGNIIIGLDRTLGNLKNGKLKKVFLSSNCPPENKADMMMHSKMTGTTVIQLDALNDELGVLCKKPFSISVLGLLK
ncbi:MAG: ribosomal L7Ae/L30e/S12e/Gadd45 family protein [Nanoarchaeota archaeon]|nr:ribosomal L7Ae/L30e/S12e/Gadd45 family protein [Nanoarchaeota archaeon]